MWSTPRWSPARDGESTIAYAQALAPSDSHDSRYTLQVMDRDGSNKSAILPVERQIDLAPPVTYDWSPDGQQLALLHVGDIYLFDLASGQVQRLTGDGQSQYLDWEE
jgi:Tol biopolymer transport system component